MVHLQGLRPYLETEGGHIDGDIAISITNLRPGEKLYEELLLGKNSIRTPHPKIFKEILSGMETIELNELYNSLVEACDLGNIEDIKTIFCHSKIGLNHSGGIVDKIL
jgi:FlaA1/EpsC-like NDP-sugar epimerase